MELSCVWVMYIVLLTITIQKTTAARLVVLRENGEPVSAEDSGTDGLSEEESEEIDFLMDLIENEAKGRDPPPVTTIRVVKPLGEKIIHQPYQLAQRSVRKERIEFHPNSFKEYHVHYHNHQHKGPIKPVMSFDEPLHPFAWGTQFQPDDIHSFKQMQKVSYPKENSFEDFETFHKTRERNPFPNSENVDPKTRLEAFKDFENLIKPKIQFYKIKQETPFNRMKKFQEYYDSEEEKVTVSNKNRFAGFKDFSDLENADKSKGEEEDKTEGEDKKTVKIKDFAIIIKTRPRKNEKVVGMDQPNSEEMEGESPGPQIPPLVNKLNVPHHKFFGMPRLLDSAGGAPKYIDALNRLKYSQHNMMNLPMPYPLNVNALQNEYKKLLHMRAPFMPPPPFPMHPHHLPPHHPLSQHLFSRHLLSQHSLSQHPLPHHPLPHHPLPQHPLPQNPLKTNMNGWIMRRLMKR